MARQRVLAALIALSLAASAAADEIRYEAVWHSGQAATLVTAPLSRQAFLDSGRELAENGFRLIDVETAVRNGRRVYAGLWTQGAGTNLFDGPMGPIELREAMEERRAEGLRLVDFEVFRSATGGRRFLAVWRNGTGEELLTGPMEQDAFFSRGENLAESGLRLIDVEVERVNGVLLYSGLFHTGTGTNLITAPLRRDQFVARRDEMRENGLELVDVERIRRGGIDRFVGAWSAGPGEGGLSLPRDFPAFFIFAQSQFNDGKHSEDFELRRIVGNDEVDDGDGGGGGGPLPTADLPDIPPEFRFSDDERLRIEWTQLDDQLFTIELPLSWLPDWLPMKDGDPILPDASCAINVRRADSIFWQVPGNPAVVTPPFLSTPSVSALGNEPFLGGVDFGGPFGSCSGTQTEFVFRFPFTTGEVPFEPLPNMSLVIEGQGSTLAGGTEIQFMAAPAPQGKVLDPTELFKDDTEKKLKNLLEAFADLFEEGEEIEEYCETVGAYWAAVCTQFPGGCPEPVALLPNCSD
jgi:hypothetical protein